MNIRPFFPSPVFLSPLNVETPYIRVSGDVFATNELGEGGGGGGPTGPKLPSFDYQELVRRILKPQRPRMVEALRTAHGMTDPWKAWERLREVGLIPSSWMDHKRRFLSKERQTSAIPGTIPLMISLASDAEGVEKAEALAHESMRRARPWLGADPLPLVWKLINPLSWRGGGWEGGWQPFVRGNPRDILKSFPIARSSSKTTRGEGIGRSVQDLLESARLWRSMASKKIALKEKSIPADLARRAHAMMFAQNADQGFAGRTIFFNASRRAKSLFQGDTTKENQFFLLLADGLAWNSAVQFGYRIPVSLKDTPSEVEGLNFREVPNPYEPLLGTEGLYSLGYLIDGIYPLWVDGQERDAMVLGIPSFSSLSK